MFGVAGDLLEPPERDPGDLREAAQEILDGGDFDEPSPTLLDRFFGWLADQIPAGPDGARGGGEGGGFSISGVFGLVVIALFAALVVWLVVRAVQQWPRRRRKDTDEPLVVIDHPLDVAEMRSTAEALTQVGDWKMAVRAWYRVAVAELIAADAIDDVPGLTPSELGAAVDQAVPQFAGLFNDATRSLEEVWYARRVATSDDVALVRQMAETAREAAVAVPGAARVAAPAVGSVGIP